ncbi:hypothetical protein, partial [Endozoicomonas sp. SESOKO3]|uniref:hypothetical protein n=2 Tax=Endozoicomonas TaxID=305899 RepID=UPI002148B0A4
CSHHLAVFKALIREKNNQIPAVTSSPSTSSGIPRSSPPAAAAISETVLIRKVSATTSRLDHEAFRTTYPTLFIFDAEQLSGKGQRAVYELPLTVPVTGRLRGVKSFQLPDNSAFVGSRIDILPVFVIEGGTQNHYVMSAPYNDSVYYLANIEIDSRNPLDTRASSATATTGYPDKTPTKQDHIPAGILYLRGAGIFVADNIRVVLDLADNHRSVQLVELGCINFSDGRGTEEFFVFRFMHSEFDLLQSVPGSKDTQSAALNVRCFQKKGQVQLTMRNTKTIVFVPTETVTPTPGLPTGSGVLFSIILWPRENVLSFVDSTCNSVVDQFGNDLTIGSAYPSDPDYYMGDVWGSYCTDVNMVQGAFGLIDREQAWGWILGDTGEHGCESSLEKTYRTGFASVSAWSSADFDVACNYAVPTAISSASSFLSASSSASLYTTQVAYTSSKLITDADNTSGPVISIAGTAELRGFEVPEKTPTWVKASIGAGLFLGGLAITQTWFHCSKRIKQTWIRYTSQALAATLGLGLPALQLLPKCVCRLRRDTVDIPLKERDLPQFVINSWLFESTRSHNPAASGQ